jgi:hypothetical protein
LISAYTMACFTSSSCNNTIKANPSLMHGKPGCQHSRVPWCSNPKGCVTSSDTQPGTQTTNDPNAQINQRTQRPENTALVPIS